MTLFQHSFNPDLSKPTCRICLQNVQDKNMSIYDLDTDVKDLLIYEKIEQCTGIKLLNNVKMPTLICEDCYGLLQVSFKFLTICKSSNDYLTAFVLSEETNLKLKKSSLKKNPLSLTNNISKTKEKYQCKARRGRRRMNLLLQTIKNEEDSLSNSPTLFENFNSDEFVDDAVDEAWDDIDYGEEDDISYGENLESSIEVVSVTKKTKNSNKSKNKITKGKNKRTLDISLDGTAIISERKSCDSKIKKGEKSKKEEQPLICDVCGNIFQRRYALAAHIKRHSDKKPYECEICGYGFYANSELRRHMRRHTGSRPYKCNYCSRAFGDKSTLIKHERIHRNEKPFKCETCGKSFTYSNVLKFHVLTHTGEKPYSCEICGKCFNTPHHLRAHLRTLQHQSDPRTEVLLQNIRKNEKGESFTVNNISRKI